MDDVSLPEVSHARPANRFTLRLVAVGWTASFLASGLVTADSVVARALAFGVWIGAAWLVVQLLFDEINALVERRLAARDGQEE